MDLRLVDLRVEVVDGLVGLPHLDSAGVGEVGDGEGRAVAEFLLGVLAVEVEGAIVALVDEVRLDDVVEVFCGLLLLLLEEVLEHRYYIFVRAFGWTNRASWSSASCRWPASSKRPTTARSGWWE